MDSLRIDKFPQFYRDLVEIAEYLADDNPDAALRFIDSVESLAALLSRTPQMGSPSPFEDARAGGLRVTAVPQFPKHLLYFRPQIDLRRVYSNTSRLARSTDRI